MKIDIISGFLGAGKTTFIKRLLKTKTFSEEKVVLIENEFGEISVDTAFLADTKVNIQELSQGCICCSLVGDFSKALKKIMEDYHPDRILIEPSGVGKLSDIISAIQNAGLSEYLNALVCLVDVKKAKMYVKNFGEFFIDQIESAHTVILSRTDVADSEKTEEALQIIREHNGKATIVTTPISLLSDEVLLEAYFGIRPDFHQELLDRIHNEECECEHHHHHDDEECGCEHHHDDDEECGCEHHHHDDDEECECGHHHHHDDDEECECGHHHHHHADEVFTSVGFETAKKYHLESLKQILNDLSFGQYGMVVRAKGVLCTDEQGWVQFNVTPSEVEILPTKSFPTGMVCVIGSQIDTDRIRKLF